MLLTPAALSSLKIDAAYINKQLAQNNADLPAGRTVLDGAEKQPARNGRRKEYRGAKQIPPSGQSGGGSVRLGDIARVE